MQIFYHPKIGTAATAPSITGCSPPVPSPTPAAYAVIPLLLNLLPLCHQLASFEESPQANFFVLCCKYAGMPSCPACSIDSDSSQSVHWHCDGAVPSVLVSLADWWGVKASRNSRSRGRQETSWISSDTHSKQGRSARLEQ